MPSYWAKVLTSEEIYKFPINKFLLTILQMVANDKGNEIFQHLYWQTYLVTYIIITVNIHSFILHTFRNTNYVNY